MSTPSVADYKDTPREELTAKISKLLKLNYEVVNANPLNTKFNCDEVAQMVYDRIATSGDFSYTNIMKIIEEFVYNQSEIDELMTKHTQQIDGCKTIIENYKKKCGEEMTPDQKFEYKRAESKLRLTESQLGVTRSFAKVLIYDQYQPDEYMCKPRDYQRMLETLNKVGNPRVTAFADWYANASIYEQNTQYESKYAEYFTSLDDLITLHEIGLGIIHVDGINLDGN